MNSLALRYECGKVEGVVTLSPKNDYSRLVCCCTDCQNFAKKLARPEALDEYGGTDILQVAPSAIEINQGTELLVCNKLSKKGSAGLDQLTPISAYLYTRDALQPVKFKPAYNKVSIIFMASAVLKILRRKIKGAGLPTPFYSENGHAITKPQRLND